MTEPTHVLLVGRPSLLRDSVHVVLANDGFEVLEQRTVEGDGVEGAVVVAVDPSPPDLDAARAMGGRVVALLPLVVGPQEAVDLVVRGADAILDGTDAPADLIAAICAVAAGRTALDQTHVRALVEALRELDGKHGWSTVSLTPRETDILRSISAGHSVKQTARALGISIKTVENLQGRLFRKLGVRNRAQAISRAINSGLIDLDEVPD